VPSVDSCRLDSPITARPNSIGDGHEHGVDEVADRQEEIYGKISCPDHGQGALPENQAVLMNSRSRMARATERICRAGHGQLKTMRRR